MHNRTRTSYPDSYPDGLTKEKKRAVRRRAATLETEKGEVFLLRKRKQKKKKQSVRVTEGNPVLVGVSLSKAFIAHMCVYVCLLACLLGPTIYQKF